MAHSMTKGQRGCSAHQPRLALRAMPFLLCLDAIPPSSHPLSKQI